MNPSKVWIVDTEVSRHLKPRLQEKGICTIYVYFNSILCLLLLRTNFRISDGLTNVSPWLSSEFILFSLESLAANPSRSCFSDSKEFLNSGMNGAGCVFNLSSAHSWSSSARIWFLCKLFFRLQRKSSVWIWMKWNILFPKLNSSKIITEYHPESIWICKSGVWCGFFGAKLKSWNWIIKYARQS